MAISLINHHIHSTGSDGKNSPEEIVDSAIKKNIKFICFTDHNKRLYACPWGENFWSKEYVNSVRRLQKKFKNKIDIALGIEIDWTSEHKKIFKKYIKPSFDFVLGSVHMIKDFNGEYFGVNFDADRFSRKVKEMGIRNIISEYFKQVRLLANSKLFTGVGHFDVIKTMNKNNVFFNEKDEFYKNEVLKTLDEIKKNKLCLEINTSGLIYGCNSMFPSLWILKEANKRKIPLTIGADTHWIERIDAGLNQAYALAKKAGYKEILKFKKRKPIKISII